MSIAYKASTPSEIMTELSSRGRLGSLESKGQATCFMVKESQSVLGVQDFEFHLGPTRCPHFKFPLLIP